MNILEAFELLMRQLGPRRVLESSAISSTLCEGGESVLLTVDVDNATFAVAIDWPIENFDPDEFSRELQSRLRKGLQ